MVTVWRISLKCLVEISKLACFIVFFCIRFFYRLVCWTLFMPLKKSLKDGDTFFSVSCSEISISFHLLFSYYVFIWSPYDENEVSCYFWFSLNMRFERRCASTMRQVSTVVHLRLLKFTEKMAVDINKGDLLFEHPPISLQDFFIKSMAVAE